MNKIFSTIISLIVETLVKYEWKFLPTKDFNLCQEVIAKKILLINVWFDNRDCTEKYVENTQIKAIRNKSSL